MKKTMIFLLALTASLAQHQCFAHAWTVSRGSCWNFISWRFEAHAQITTWYSTSYATGYDCLGRWVGTGTRAYTGTVCDHSSQGCSRPQIADCNVSGTVADVRYSTCGILSSVSFPYFGHARAENQISGPHFTFSTSGRAAAGWSDSVDVDSAIFAGLSSDGWSNGDVTGDATVNEANQLVISNLTGSVTIAASKDNYSKIQIMVVKENDGITQEQENAIEAQRANGVFTNVVYSTQIYVSKGSIVKDGVFNTLPPGALTPASAPGSFGINLNNINVVVPLDVTLAPGEHLSVVTLLDGGFDVSSAITHGHPSKPALMATAEDVTPVRIYPNPASKSVNCQVYSETDNASISIKAFDLSGKETGQIHSGTVPKGTSTVEHIDVSHLLPGIQTLEVKVGDKTTYRKITITQ